MEDNLTDSDILWAVLIGITMGLGLGYLISQLGIFA